MIAKKKNRNILFVFFDPQVEGLGAIILKFYYLSFELIFWVI